MPTHTTITDALKALPVGADNIAAHLADLGVEAQCSNPHRCALAEYLTLTVEGADGVRVGRMFASSPNESHGTSFMALGRPDITAFVDAFDSRRYPALIAPALVAA